MVFNPDGLFTSSDFPTTESAYATGEKASWAAQVAQALISIRNEIGIAGSTVTTSHDFRIAKAEQAAGYHVERGGVKASNTAAQNGTAIRALIAAANGLGIPIEFVWPAGQILVDRDPITATGMFHNANSRISHRGQGILTTQLVFTSTTAGDVFMKWAGGDNADYSGRCRNGGCRDMSIRSQTPGAPTHGVVAFGSDGFSWDRFTIFAFGRNGMQLQHYTDSTHRFLSFDHCGSQSGAKYAALEILSGANWGCDSLDFEHPRFEQCPFDLRIRAGAHSINKITFHGRPKFEHEEQITGRVVELDGTTGSPGTTVEDIVFMAGDLHVNTVSATLPDLFLAKGVGALKILGWHNAMASTAVANAYMRLEDCPAPTLVGITGNVGGTAARPSKGIVQLAGTIAGLNPYPDVKWNWNGSSFGGGDGMSAPYAITKDTGANVTYAPNPATAGYPPTV